MSTPHPELPSQPAVQLVYSIPCSAADGAACSRTTRRSFASRTAALLIALVAGPGGRRVWPAARPVQVRASTAGPTVPTAPHPRRASHVRPACGPGGWRGGRRRPPARPGPRRPAARPGRSRRAPPTDAPTPSKSTPELVAVTAASACASSSPSPFALTSWPRPARCPRRRGPPGRRAGPGRSPPRTPRR